MNTLGSMDMMRRMVARLGENGYVAVDSGNQIDMTQAEQAFDFCKAVDEKEMDEFTIIVVMEMGMGKTTCFSVIGARRILEIWTFMIYLTGSIQ